MGTKPFSLNEALVFKVAFAKMRADGDRRG